MGGCWIVEIKSAKLYPLRLVAATVRVRVCVFVLSLLSLLLLAMFWHFRPGRLYTLSLNWFVCFYDCVLVPAPRASWIAIGLTGRKGMLLCFKEVLGMISFVSNPRKRSTHLLIYIHRKKCFY